MATVESMLKTKGNAVYTVSPEDTVLTALKLMAEKNIGAVLVVDGGTPIGIFSERDYARRGILKGNNENSPVKTLMTQPVFYISPDRSADSCMALMVEKHFRHLPVVKDGKLIGLISINDVIKTVIKDQKALIAGLENFMLGQEIQL